MTQKMKQKMTQRVNRRKIAVILAGLLLLPSVKIAVEAAGVTVPTDVRDLADSLKKEENEKEIKDKAKAEAKVAVDKLQQEKTQLDKGEYIHDNDPRLAKRRQLEEEQLAHNKQMGEMQQSSKELEPQ